MRIAERVNLDIADLDKDMTFLSQLGVTELGIMIRGWEPWFGNEPIWHKSPGSRLRETDYYEYEDLLALREWVESYGLRLYSIMGLNLFRSEWTRPGDLAHERMIDNIKESIRNMGRAGVPQFCAGSRGFAGISVKSPFGLNHWRTSVEAGRGHAKVVKFDNRLAQTVPLAEFAPVTSQAIWDDTAHILREISPVAEEANVTICHHPADPPVPSLCGVARILCSVEDFDRLLALAPGNSNRVIFCLGCFSQMMDPDGVYQAIRHFGNKIAEVHFRNVIGNREEFVEVYPDEGKLDMVTAIRTLKEVGFDGPVAIDHTPKGIDDTFYGHRGRAFEIGYLKGLLQSADAVS